MVNINKYIKALMHPAGGHQGSHKAHQAGNQALGMCSDDSGQKWNGSRFNVRTVFPIFPILKGRRSHNRFIFTVGISVLIRRKHYIERNPWLPDPASYSMFSNLYSHW